LMRSPRLFTISAGLGLWLSSVAATAAPAACKPPAGFNDTPHPAIAPAEQLAVHTEQIDIARPFPVVVEAMNMPLHQALRGSGSLPGVAGDFMLDRYVWGTASRLSPEAPVPVVAHLAQTALVPAQLDERRARH